MKSILGITGSPRKLGNCEIMVKEISRCIDVPHTLKLLRIDDFSLSPCRGCYTCLFKDECIIDDDLKKIIHEIADADAIILAAPAYFLAANSSLKRIVDRGLSFYAHIGRMWAKPSVGVAIAGIEGKEGHTLLGVENFLKAIFSDLKGTAVVYGALPGEVFLNDSNRSVAKKMADALFSEKKEEKEGVFCGLCGGRTFRFLGGDRIRCMLCSNEGSITFDGLSFSATIREGEHPMILTKEAAIAHKEWLKSMKSRFFEKKDALKKVCLPYLKHGERITP